MASQRVFLLILALKYEVEDAERAVKAVRHYSKRWCQPVMHGKRMAGYAILTNEPAKSLVDRLRPALDESAIDNWWCVPIGSDIVAKHGSFDPLGVRVAEAFERLREFPDPKDMRNPKPADIFGFFGVEDGDRSAAIKMSIKNARKGQTPRNPDRP